MPKQQQSYMDDSDARERADEERVRGVAEEGENEFDTDEEDVDEESEFDDEDGSTV
jgi:hypothetical protein